MKTRDIVIIALFLAAGIFIGWLLFGGGNSNNSNEAAEHAHTESESHVWTCSMHPQIRQDKSGKCPICAMDLIPLRAAGAPASGAALDPDALMMSDEAVALANIQTTVVSRTQPIKEIRLYGTIQADERRARSQVSHVNGRIEKLFVNFTGETVRQGQTIATVYSPDLLNAQQELLEAAKSQSFQPLILMAAREKLRLWKLTDFQIEEIERSGTASPLMDITANTAGTIIAKRVEQGDYVTPGSILFDIADLSSVWAIFNAYESDLPFLHAGDLAEYTLQALPGKTFTGRITAIDPILDKTTRTAKVRIETPNPSLRLKPEMYAAALVKTSLKGDPANADANAADAIVIPKTAVLWTGKRSIVYVKQPDSDQPVFRLREITLGTPLDNAYTVLSGLSEGEEIVTNGTFTVDASAQLEGKRSMMNNDQAVATAVAVAPAPAHTGDHATMTVQGLCEMCKDRIESAARAVAGVSSAKWDMETKQLHLHYDSGKTTLEAISKALAQAGHDTDRHKASAAAYDALPDCCKYR
ncbi:Cation efflux system protein CusB precursor [Bacteroidales bacterium Barb6XT]|nr:Cation efflux system protein CusB precursor [Bacteroidales bacterium Barb6XT]